MFKGKCVECQTEVSKFASKCPNCGKKNPALTTKNKIMIWGFFAVAIAFFIIVPSSPSNYYLKYKDSTVEDVKGMSSSSLKKISDSYAIGKGSAANTNYYFDCLGDYVYEKGDSIKIAKLMNWCSLDLNENKPHYNTAVLLDGFSGYNGSHRGVEVMIKQNLHDPSSYIHDNTAHSFVYYGTDRPHVAVKTTFVANNALGGKVKSIAYALIDAKSKQIYDFSIE
jgi:hypothetical protein